MSVHTTELLRKLLVDLERELEENGRDFAAFEAERAKLTEERRTLIHGIEGIRAELKTMEVD